MKNIGRFKQTTNRKDMNTMKTVTAGKIIHSLSFDDYLEIKAVNASLLVHAIHSWKQFLWVRSNGFRPKTDTETGTALHTFVERMPDKDFGELYAVMPNYRLYPENATGTGKPSTSRTAWVKDQEAAYDPGGRQVLTQQQYDRAERMAKAVKANPAAMQLIDDSGKELSVIAEINGVLCKGRVDGLNGSTMWDVKTTNDIARHRFGQTAANLKYVLKMAFYLRLLSAVGIEIDRVVLIAIQDSIPREDGGYNEAPDCCVYEIPMIALENQMSSIDRLLNEYVDCMSSNQWPGCSDGDLVVPNWSMEETDLVD